MTSIAQLFFLTSYRLLRLCFPNYTGLVEGCLVAVDGARQDRSCDYETQNGKAAISLSLPFEFVIFCIGSRADVTRHIWISPRVWG